MNTQAVFPQEFLKLTAAIQSKETYGAVYLWPRFIWLTKESGVQFAISIFGTKYFKFRNFLDMLISILHNMSC